MKCYLSYLLFLLALSCVSTSPKQPVPQPVEPPKPGEPVVVHPPVILPAKPDCSLVSEKILLNYAAVEGKKTIIQHYTQQMPVTKPIAHEAHYLIKNLDPKVVNSQTDAIAVHLARTCKLLTAGMWAKFYPGVKTDCASIYDSAGGKEWTPPEPDRGRGSGDYYPSVECEAATGNMFWGPGASPKPGTRFLVKNPKNGKSFVLCMGYEAGPGDKVFAGGIGTEAMKYLGAQHGSTLTLGRAVDQTLAYGPIECAN